MYKTAEGGKSVLKVYAGSDVFHDALTRFPFLSRGLCCQSDTYTSGDVSVPPTPPLKMNLASVVASLAG